MEIIGNISTTESPITGTTSAIQNAGESPSIQAGLQASLPPAGEVGRLYVSTDTNTILRDTGSFWTSVSGTSAAASGTTFSIQVNQAGVLTGSAAFAFNPSTNTLSLTGSNPGIVMAGATAEPSLPAAGQARLYARNVADRIVPKWIGPSGVDYLLQSHFGGNNIRGWRGGNTTAAGTFASILGSMPYTSGSPVAPTIPVLSTTNVLAQTRRSTISTTTTANTLAFIRANQTEVWRGNAAGLGGFFVIIRFGLSGTLQSGLRAFAGLNDVAANPTNVNPLTTNNPGGVGVAIAANTGNWSIVHNITGTARTVIDLGVSFAADNISPLELVLFCAPNTPTISWRMVNLRTNSQSSGVISTNIPTSTTFLVPTVWITNNTTAAAQTLDFISLYVETDF